MKQILVLIFLLLSQGAFAQAKVEGVLNQLLAPGPLHLGHENLEHKQCLKCHELAGGIPDKNCLRCHKDIAVHKKNKIKFHGLESKNCVSCHKDHKGRTFNSMAFDHKKFNHDRTGFKLEGGHTQVECKDCHTTLRSKKRLRKKDMLFFGTNPSCKSCHTKDDIHFFPKSNKWARKDCNTCHNTSKWDQVNSFNHGKETGYVLQGNHAKQKCDKCHTPTSPTSRKYKWPNLKRNACLSCHKDHHKANLKPRFRGGNCNRCHNQFEWEIASFKHSITGFSLRGAHAKTTCVECHTQGAQIKSRGKKFFNWTNVSSECSSCHEDYHGFSSQQGKKIGPLKRCASCHNEFKWKPGFKFNHNRQTNFKLDGKHLQNKCFDCHKTSSGRIQAPKNTPRRYHFSELRRKSCETCHKDPHNREFHKLFKGMTCEQCHNTSSWKNINQGKFSGDFHDRTAFPLTGKHKKQSCDSCHKVNGKQVYKFPGKKNGFCLNCHKNIHKKQFHSKIAKRSCGSCHNTTSFTNQSKFNHDTVRFRITGAHKKIEKKCSKCHVKTAKYLPTKPRKRAGKFKFKDIERGFCLNCHVNEHKKMFSRELSEQTCLNCHNTTNFRDRKDFNHDVTDFNLKFKHLKVKCFECHKKTSKRFKQKPNNFKHKFLFSSLRRKNCNTCHEDVHKGAMGPKCSSCHTERGWKVGQDFHREFTLSGIHGQQDCASCHSENIKLKGMSGECSLCHSTADPHGGTLPQCSQCHTQNVWQAVKFQHDAAAFPLTGSHRLASCQACHGSGQYQGLPSDCQTCHLMDAQMVTEPDHSSPNYQSCRNCHNTFSFK